MRADSRCGISAQAHAVHDGDINKIVKKMCQFFLLSEHIIAHCLIEFRVFHAQKAQYNLLHRYSNAILLLVGRRKKTALSRVVWASARAIL